MGETFRGNRNNSNFRELTCVKWSSKLGNNLPSENLSYTQYHCFNVLPVSLPVGRSEICSFLKGITATTVKSARERPDGLKSSIYLFCICFMFFLYLCFIYYLFAFYVYYMYSMFAEYLWFIYIQEAKPDESYHCS